jgi:predicted nucleic acid-binding protein
VSQLVVDSSAVVSALLDAGSDGSWVRAQLAIHDLDAPDIVLVEACNVLRRLELRGTVPEKSAAAAFAGLTAFPINYWPAAMVAGRAWQLRGSITSYDGMYVALAEKLTVPLLTLDGRLASAPGPRCKFLTLPGAT